MPEMNGFEFCEQVKQDPNLAGSLFVVLSGFGDTALKVKGLNLGVDDYLTKPIEVPELIARVRATPPAQAAAGPAPGRQTGDGAAAR